MPSITPPTEAFLLLNGFRAYQMVVAACELKLPDLIAAGPKDADALAAETGAHAPSLRRMCRALAALGVFYEKADGSFGPTSLSDWFRSDQPGLRDMTLMLSGDVYQAWGRLADSVRSGRSAYELVFGKNHFDAMADDPEASARFNAAMVESTTRIADAFVAAYDFAGADTVVDVGGGTGTLVAAVLRANPRMRGVLFDLPQGLHGAAERLKGEGIGDRVTIVDGSFFETIPPGGDVYILKSIVHDWDDDHALAILKTCRRAASPDAKLVLVERRLPERVDMSRVAREATMGDMQMMVVLGGRERTIDEYGGLLEAAEFRMTRMVPIDAAFGAVEAVPIG